MTALLELQTKLAEYIADPARYKHGRDDAQSDPLFSGMDLDRLALMGRLTLDKRHYKMRSVLPKTFERLGDQRDAVIEDFAVHYRPISLSGEQDARRFQEYLSIYGRKEFGLPPALEDLAALEIALWSVGREALAGLEAGGGINSSSNQIRRVGDLVLLSCHPGIRSLMRDASPQTQEDATRIHLAIAKDLDSKNARVFEVNQRAFELLSSLSEWIEVEAICDRPGDFDELNELAATGLIQAI